jgi:hypothetical protein
MLDEMVGVGNGEIEVEARRFGHLCGAWLRLVATRARRLNDGGEHYFTERTGKVLARNSHVRESRHALSLGPFHETVGPVGLVREVRAPTPGLLSLLCAGKVPWSGHSSSGWHSIRLWICGLCVQF